MNFSSMEQGRTRDLSPRFDIIEVPAAYARNTGKLDGPHLLAVPNLGNAIREAERTLSVD